MTSFHFIRRECFQHIKIFALFFFSIIMKNNECNANFLKFENEKIKNEA
jgi:hypothetical protein